MILCVLARGMEATPRVAPADPQKGIRHFQKVGYLLATFVIALGFGLIISFTPALGPSSEVRGVVWWRVPIRNTFGVTQFYTGLLM